MNRANLLQNEIDSLHCYFGDWRLSVLDREITGWVQVGS